MQKCNILSKNNKHCFKICVFEAKLVDFHESIFDDYSYVSDSFAYMSPEMLNEDYKTDVFSFGIILYYLFSGELPKQKFNDKMAG